MDFLLGNKGYVLVGEYIEHNQRSQVDEVDSWEAPIPFTYKDITRARTTEQVITGLVKATQSVVIETRTKLPYKPRDIIKIDRGDFKITRVDYIEDDNYTAKQIFSGLDYTKAVLVLE
jgi:hypothetical protein